MWSVDEVLDWLAENNLASLVPVFRLHKIDGRELDRIREKNDSKVSFSNISHFLERIVIERIETKNSLESKLPIDSICSFRIHSRK